MRVIELPTLWTILLDSVAWLVIHIAAALITLKIPDRHFREDRCLYKIHAWEKDGRIWQEVFKIKRWKKWLPDGASIARRGYDKRKLRSTDPADLEKFILETRRAELTHVIAIPPALLFFLWNPWTAGVIMIVYALLLNVPCLIAQRYNRPRFEKVLMQKQLKSKETEREQDG